ncbi:hypothetical protein E1B28_003682 [Marasmius oreades]|uniref:Zn(2)-C6 fungal-type domain-containing protein n=1 Tax=Marasmius oreades TaxID=181124 RepID=A0A9P7UX30_9AGAR|nr:uncharacterized protein E1B28_003682 [Marasmius oreades]KAG7096233.1 hypothetical protein E1B28_003682 [Marasmius oreades]
MSEGRTVSRPTQSCFQCRNRKIKCNRSHPCAACLLRGEGDTCHEVEKIIARAIGPGVTVEAVDEVLSKVVALEQSVSKLSKMISKNGPVEDSSETESMHHLGPQKRVLSSPPPAGSKIQATRPEQKASMMLADQLAMGNRMNGRRNSMQSEAERAISSSPVDPPIPLPSSSKFPPNANGISHDHPLSLLVRPATSIVFQILSHLPDETDSRSLIRFYFDRIEWYTRILHYPTFSYDAKILTRQISDSASSASSGSTAATHFSLPFLSTYFMVLCLAYHFIEFDMCKVLDNTFEDAAKMSKKMYNAAQLCLWIDNYLENHSLEGVQTLILMGIYQQNLGDSDSHWALLGSAIKIAQILGVDRLGTESDRKSYPGPWKSVVRREVGRRVWWNLIHNEWSNAATHNGAYTIVPSQNNTGLPLNVNDIDLEDDLDPIEPAPHTEYTEMTYSLMRFRFVEIHRQIMDSVENHPTGFRPSFITEIDSRVLTMLKDLPAAFQAPGVSTGERSSLSFKGVKSIEYTISLITAEAMRMRLHRPFLFRGYTEERYGPSKQQCVASAKAILKYLKYDIGQTTVLLRRWSVMFFGFTAAIVLLVDYCQQKGAGALQDSRKELQSALNMFKMVQVSSNAAQSFIPLLESMVAAAERNLTSNTSNKHSGGHHDVWSEIAKEAFVSSHPYLDLLNYWTS